MTPARAVNHFPEIGTLGEGKEADIAVLELEEGVFAYHDAWEMKRLGTRRIVNNSEGLSRTDWSKAGPYTNYR